MGGARGLGPDHDLRTEYLRLKAALYDPNTDLRSIPAVLDSVRTLFELGRWVGVIHLAVDQLDRIESIYGWQATDRLLTVVSRSLMDARGSVLPPETVLAQSGIYGGSFAAFLPVPGGAASPRESLDDRAARLQAVLEHRFRSPEFETMVPRVGFRLGFAAMCNEPFFRLERIIYQALDEAANFAEHDGARERSRDQAELKRILDEGDIDVLFQPVMDLDHDTIIGYEAFCRGPRDTALESPAALFGVSREAARSRDLDMLCHQEALRRAVSLGSGAKLFLNALPSSLLDPGFRDHLMRDLPEGLQIRAEDIIIEIADRNAIEDFRLFESEVGELRTQGFRLGVDDVGTGAGSLQTIAEVKPDYIKVDGSLIHDIHLNLVKQEMLRSLSKVAQSIKATLIAEGIESGEDLQVVRRCGVHYGQGFLFAPPGHELPVTLPGP